MTNGEKYKTAQERAEAFVEFCRDCSTCKIRKRKIGGTEKDICTFYWLALECEEKNPETIEDVVKEMLAWPSAIDTEDAKYLAERILAAHNRVAKAVRESEGHHG